MYAYIIDQFDFDGTVGVFDRELASDNVFYTKRQAVENLAGTGYKATRAIKLPTFFNLKRDGKLYRLEIVNLHDPEQRDRYETVRETMSAWA